MERRVRCVLWAQAAKFSVWKFVGWTSTTHDLPETSTRDSRQRCDHSGEENGDLFVATEDGFPVRLAVEMIEETSTDRRIVPSLTYDVFDFVKGPPMEDAFRMKVIRPWKHLRPRAAVEMKLQLISATTPSGVACT